MLAVIDFIVAGEGPANTIIIGRFVRHDVGREINILPDDWNECFGVHGISLHLGRSSDIAPSMRLPSLSLLL